jgi:hypothetical protein
MDSFPEVSWTAPEFVKNQRTADWYWGISLLGIAGVFAAVYFGNYLFGGVILLSIVLIIAFSTKPVFEFPVEIYSDAIVINKKRVMFSKLDAFWIYHHPREGAKLLLDSSTVILPFYVIPLNGRVDESDIREALKDKVAESELRVPILLQIFEVIF